MNNQGGGGGKKNFKFAKMRFTDLKNKIVKKTNIDAEKSEEKVDSKEAEKFKKQLQENEMHQIENELDNKKLLLQVMDSESVTEHIDDYFTRDRILRSQQIDKDGVIKTEELLGQVIINEEIKKEKEALIRETLDEFWKKYRSFNDTNRKGNMKVMTPSYGFIKSSQENLLIPNPIGLLNRNGENDSISLR